MVKAGEYRNRELLCLHKEIIWLMECGDVDQYGSFEKFKGKVLQARILKTDKGLSYLSPSGEVLKFGWDYPCRVNNCLLNEKEYPLFENGTAFGEYGKGIIFYRTSDQCLNFQY